MYCSTCGTVLTPGLSYCNRCGVSLVEKESPAVKLSKMAMENLVWAIVAMATLGIGAVIALIALLTHNLHLSDKHVIMIAFAAAVPFLIAELVFILTLFRAMDTSTEISTPGIAKRTQTRELDEAPPRALAEPMMSVVDQTTRTL